MPEQAEGQVRPEKRAHHSIALPPDFLEKVMSFILAGLVQPWIKSWSATRSQSILIRYANLSSIVLKSSKTNVSLLCFLHSPYALGSLKPS